MNAATKNKDGDRDIPVNKNGDRHSQGNDLPHSSARAISAYSDHHVIKATRSQLGLDGRLDFCP